MERVMSQEERIKRAEEIYNRRKMGNGVRVSTNSVNVGKKNKVSLGKKMLIQLLVCTLIYAFISAMKNKDNNFSKQTIETVSNVLNYDIDIIKVYSDCTNYIKNSNFLKFNFVKEKTDVGEKEVKDEKIKDDEVKDEEVKDEEVKDEEKKGKDVKSEEVKDEELKNEEATDDKIKEEQTEYNNGIGGSDISNEQMPEPEKSQMEIDAEYIKENCNLIVPVKGYITSGFGNREPTEIISAFHQGIDIGATQGTEIHAAMDGKVIAASYAGDYGNHIKIQNGEVITVYAHCSKLNVSVGDEVLQNQVIGKVGATRKSNRATLTF